LFLSLQFRRRARPGQQLRTSNKLSIAIGSQDAKLTAPGKSHVVHWTLAVHNLKNAVPSPAYVPLSCRNSLAAANSWLA